MPFSPSWWCFCQNNSFTNIGVVLWNLTGSHIIRHHTCRSPPDQLFCALCFCGKCRGTAPLLLRMLYVCRMLFPGSALEIFEGLNQHFVGGHLQHFHPEVSVARPLFHLIHLLPSILQQATVLPSFCHYVTRVLSAPAANNISLTWHRHSQLPERPSGFY